MVLKRYVQTGTFVTTSTTALAKMNQDSPTYSEPYLYGYQIGSLFRRGYVVICSKMTGCLMWSITTLVKKTGLCFPIN
jgi:hypothetical protein